MRVLLFTHHLVSGGAEKTVRALAEYLNTHPELGVEAGIAVVYDDEDCRRSMRSPVIVFKNASSPGDGRMKKAVNVIRQIAEMRRIKREFRPDICVSFLPGADIINVLSGTGEKKIVSVRNKESLFVHGAGKKLYVKTAYRLSDLIVCVSEAVREDVIGYFGVPGNKVRTVPNWLAPAPEEEEPEDETFRRFTGFIRDRKCVISVARLKPEKGQIHLLRAFARVAKDREDAVLVLVGDGTDKEKLKKLSEGLGTGGRVFFAGQQKNPYPYLSRADLFVLSSNIEGMPNVVLEAMQCGVPVAATDCGAGELIGRDGERGVLLHRCGDYTDAIPERYLDPSSPLTEQEEEMARTILTLLGDSERREIIRAAARDYVKEYAPDHIVRLWLDSFTTVFEKHG